MSDPIRDAVADASVAAIAEAWNGLRDALTALESLLALVEANRPYADASAVLVAQNIG